MRGQKHKNYSNILIRIIFFEQGLLLSNFASINCFYLETVFVVFFFFFFFFFYKQPKQTFINLKQKYNGLHPYELDKQYKVEYPLPKYYTHSEIWLA